MGWRSGTPRSKFDLVSAVTSRASGQRSAVQGFGFELFSISESKVPKVRAEAQHTFGSLAFVLQSVFQAAVVIASGLGRTLNFKDFRWEAVLGGSGCLQVSVSGGLAC